MKKLLISFFSLLMLLPLTVHGENHSTPIEVTMDYPENQNPAVKGYYELNTKANQNQTLTLKLKNNTEEAINVSLNPANAYTSETGDIAYLPESNSNKLKLIENSIEMKKYIKVQESVSIEPKTIQEIPVEVTTPDAQEGTFLGAVLVQYEWKKIEESAQANDGEANFITKVQMENRIAVQLNLPAEAPGNVSVGKFGVEDDESMYFELKNEAQRIQGDISGHYTVTNESGEVVHEKELAAFKMAPKTEVKHPIEFGEGEITEGVYTVDVKLNVEGRDLVSTGEIEIEEEFVEKQTERREGSQHSETQSEDQGGIKLAIYIVIGLLFGILMFGLGRRKK